MHNYKGSVTEYQGFIWGTCDRYEEEDDGSCSNVFEIYIKAPNREELDKLRKDLNVTVTIVH